MGKGEAGGHDAARQMPFLGSVDRRRVCLSQV